MTNLSTRFDRNVDRSGEHHLWLGAVNPGRGTGRIKVAGKTVPANRVAWELANGPVPPTQRVLACPEEPTCVRVDHLRLAGDVEAQATITELVPRRAVRRRGRKGGGSMREIRPGVWKFSVTAEPYGDGSPRRVHRTVHGLTNAEATVQLAAFVIEVANATPPADRDSQALTMDEAMKLFLEQHLRDDKGREEKTVRDYWNLHAKWFAPQIGEKLPRQVDERTMDRLFGDMRRAGLSDSRINQATSLYGPFFKWAKRRGMVRRSPMAEFERPTSTQIATERVPPEVEELSLYLKAAVEIIPEAAPLLVVGAVCGARRGELVGLRRSRVNWRDGQLTVDSAIDGKRVKPTKNRKERSFHVDEETLAMLARLCDEQDDLARAAGIELDADPYLFTLAIDCSEPMAPDYVTKRVALLKSHLGVEDKRPETIELEDEALRLYRTGDWTRPAGRTGPAPRGGMTFREIGERLERSERWAAKAVASAERREAVRARGDQLAFDGSIIALRKFTSSELLDAGFNISMVAQRQGHGPQVLAKHYAKGRKSADRKAAEHLGRVVHHHGVKSEGHLGADSTLADHAERQARSCGDVRPTPRPSSRKG